MLFHEVYGKYYLALEKMIEAAQQRALTMSDIRAIAAKTAFSESSMEFEAAVREERWPVIGKNGTTPLGECAAPTDDAVGASMAQDDTG